MSLRKQLGIVGLSALLTGLSAFGVPGPAPLVIPNGDFETLKEDGYFANWGRWWQREGKGSAKASSEAHGGKVAAHLVNDNAKDWAFSNGKLFQVKAGDEYLISGWMKVTHGGDASIQAIAYDKDKQRVSWCIGDTSIGRPANKDWQQVSGYFQVPKDVAFVSFRVVGSGLTDMLVDDITVVPGSEADLPKPPASPKVEGFAKEPVVEKFGRSVFAQQTESGVYISWRLLAEDAKDIGFDVYRVSGGKSVKLNERPIVQTCDWQDGTAYEEGVTYEVRPSEGFSGKSGSSIVHRVREDRVNAPRVIALRDPKARVGKVGIGDLNGDGEFDYIVQTPISNVDPWHVYWYPSEETFKVEAYLSDGTFLWSFDRGWAIETGIWYSPFVVADLNGDGKAEVALKAGDGDPRTKNGLEKGASAGCTGMVESGEEYVVILDGMTGKEIARASWPSREGFSSYNFYSRNQLAVARLDGKTPCLITLRGTYTLMKAEAWQLKDGKMEVLWTYDSSKYGRKYRGQGAHTTLVADLDNDGRDEIILGSVVLDDNGDPLWTTGKGHPDGVYYGDIIPSRPGMEIAYVMETQQMRGGLHVLDAETGKIIWQLQVPTKHVHGSGTCADISPIHPGVELAGSDADGHKLTDKRWMFTGDGILLHEGVDMPFGFGATTIFWDADLQAELFRGGKFSDYEGGECGGRSMGSNRLIADVTGDWREEVITTVPGELRIYSTSIPAMDRRVCLMQDCSYRMRHLTNAMGYTSRALLTRLPSAESPNVNLTYQYGMRQLRIVMSAPVHSPLKGRFELDEIKGVKVEGERAFDVDLQPGKVLVKNVRLISDSDEGFNGQANGRLTLSDGIVLKGTVPVRSPAPKLKNALIVEAEDFIAEKGGAVQKRKDKVGTQGLSLSHWDSVGHSLTWRIRVKEAGKYKFAARYCNASGAERSIAVNGKDYGAFFLYGTGGLGNEERDWENFVAVRNGEAIILDLPAGEHEIVMTNTKGQPCNLDFVALIKVTK